MMYAVKQQECKIIKHQKEQSKAERENNIVEDLAQRMVKVQEIKEQKHRNRVRREIDHSLKAQASKAYFDHRMVKQEDEASQKELNI